MWSLRKGTAKGYLSPVPVPLLPQLGLQVVHHPMRMSLWPSQVRMTTRQRKKKSLKTPKGKLVCRTSSAICSKAYLLLAKNLEKKVWRSVVYAFYQERPKVVRKDNRKGNRTTYLEFHCLKCSKTYLRGTGTDSGSTGVMRNHIPQCWGEDVWLEAKNLELDPAKEVVKKFKTMKNVKLTEMFARVPGSKETFSLSPPSREEIRYIAYALG
jgi:hypothetical protein